MDIATTRKNRPKGRFFENHEDCRAISIETQKKFYNFLKHIYRKVDLEVEQKKII